ncbi:MULTISPECIES: hypothetical protein [unclassified Mesorhizobium]|uniref:hypothetical protein n=1 Tax=unclassified Mesorhizobium TaxID=325217 RepID=UPI001FD01852|nr:MULTISPECIES: hypothetical protein [unclassified Mesorhizobium]
MVDVCIVMGVAINDAQNGEQHLAVKALKGFGGRILAVVDDLDRDTYRPSMPLRWCDLHLCLRIPPTQDSDSAKYGTGVPVMSGQPGVAGSR